MFLSRSCKECHRNIRAVEHKKYLGKGSYRENLSAHGRLTEPTCLRLPANFRVFRPWSRTAELCVDFNPEQHMHPWNAWLIQASSPTLKTCNGAKFFRLEGTTQTRHPVHPNSSHQIVCARFGRRLT